MISITHFYTDWLLLSLRRTVHVWDRLHSSGLCNAPELHNSWKGVSECVFQNTIAVFWTTQPNCKGGSKTLSLNIHEEGFLLPSHPCLIINEGWNECLCDVHRPLNLDRFAVTPFLSYCSCSQRTTSPFISRTKEAILFPLAGALVQSLSVETVHLLELDFTYIPNCQ